MNIDGSFVENGITADNLSVISERQSELCELRICELTSLAYDAAELIFDMLNSGYGLYEALSVLSEGVLFPDKKLHQGYLSENYLRLLSHLGSVAAMDKVVFSEFLSSELLKRNVRLSELDFLIDIHGSEMIGYVKNPLADEAFDVFSQQLNDPRVKYYKSLQEAGRAVSLGDCEYAILPLEEKGGSRLSSVLELLFKEDLKINSVTPVFGYDGNADVKYALVSKHFKIPSLEEGDDRYLEIRLRADASIPLSELLFASDSLGAKLYRINTISFDTDDGQIPFYSIVFRDEGGDFSSLLLYLTLFSGVYTTVGIYKNLE